MFQIWNSMVNIWNIDIPVSNNIDEWEDFEIYSTNELAELTYTDKQGNKVGFRIHKIGRLRKLLRFMSHAKDNSDIGNNPLDWNRSLFNQWIYDYKISPDGKQGETMMTSSPKYISHGIRIAPEKQIDPFVKEENEKGRCYVSNASLTFCLH